LGTQAWKALLQSEAYARSYVLASSAGTGGGSIAAQGIRAKSRAKSSVSTTRNNVVRKSDAIQRSASRGFDPPLETAACS
jgi:hypothetical protein